MIDEALPVVANEGLADYVDAFCEKGYFGLEETQSLLDAAASHGIKSKVHVNQFNAFGGVKLCVNSNSVSVDHLEELSAEDVEALKSPRIPATHLRNCTSRVLVFLGHSVHPGA